MTVDSARRPAERAVITGMGVIAPTGIGAAAHWDSIVTGRTGIVADEEYRSAGYRATLSGRITDFDPMDFMPKKLAVQTDRWTQLALAGTSLALKDADVDTTAIPEFKLGVITGSSSGGNEFGQRQIERLWKGHPDEVSAYQSIAWFYAATTGQVSIRHGARGPSSVVVSEQAAGLDALAGARRALRDGADLMLSGGTEAPLSPFAHVCQEASGLLTDATDPNDGYRPFDVAASGYTPGEGGAMFTVESVTAYERRSGTSAYGEITGYASTFDPDPRSGRPPALGRAISLALTDAGIRPSEVDVVFADAMAVPHADLVEAEAIAEVFGDHGVPVTAPKSLTGRLYGGGASLDVATALCAMRHGVIPRTASVSDVPDSYRIDLVRDASRVLPIRHAIVLARGYGGFNSALVLSALV